MRVYSLSIIVPFTGQTEPFEATLASVLQNRPASAEVIVAHTGCYDDPWRLGDEVRFAVAPRRSNLARLINVGVDAARGEVVHWLRGGLQVSDGWVESAISHFDDSSVASVSPLISVAEQPDRVVAAGVGYAAGGRRRLLRHEPSEEPRAVRGPTIWAAFYRRSAFTLLGGFDVALGDQLTDVDLALSLESLGYSSVFEPSCRIDSETLGGAGQRGSGFRAQRAAERIFWRHAQREGWLKSLALHPWTVGVDFLTGLPSAAACLGLMGRSAAWLELAGPSKRRRRLRHAQRLAMLQASDERQSTPPNREPGAAADLKAA